MKLSEIDQEIEKLKMDKESKQAFLKLMDFKIEADMDKVINAIGGLKNEISTFDHKLEASIGSLKESILSNRNEMNTKFDSSRNEMKSSISNIRWTIALWISIATIIIGILNFLSRYFVIK